MERYGPQNKKSRTKSFTLDNNSDTSDSEVECDGKLHYVILPFQRRP